MRIADLAFALIVVVAIGSACRERDAASSPRADGTPTTAAVPTIESELSTFRSGMTEPAFLAGPPSRDSLVRLFERALAKRDAKALDRLQITREEFAYLYYPESKMSRPPYELGPDVMWLQIESQRGQGLRRLVAKYGNPGFRVRKLYCAPPEHGHTIVIYQCTVSTSGAGGSNAMQLFGSIVERDGRFKFVGYANRL